MSSLDLVQITVLGCATGFGSAMGAEFAKTLVSMLRERKKNRGDNN